jgi:site-specific DNA recombinase
MVVKDRATGRRTPRMKPQSEWKRTPVPHLAIIDRDTWDRSQARRQARAAIGARTLGNQRRPGIFTGLIKCGVCGASYTAYTGGRMICAGWRERGPAACSNRRTFARADLEATILDGIREQLLTPDAVEAYVAAWQAARRRRLAAQAANRDPLEKRLGLVKRGIERVVDAIVDGTANDAMKARMQALDLERQQLEAQLAKMPKESIITINPRAARNLAAKVARLQETLQSRGSADSTEHRAQIEAVREIVQKIDVRPRTQERGGPIDVVLHGVLAPLVFAAPERRGNECMTVTVAGGSAGHAHTWPAARLPLEMKRAFA